MPVAAAVVGGAAVLGASYLGSKSASKSASKARDAQERQAMRQLEFEYTKWDEYLKDLESRRVAVENDRRQQRLLASRKFDAAMKDWKVKDKAITEMVQTYKGFEKDPSSTPGWRGFSDAIAKEAQKSIKGLSGQMERAGRTGGSQDRMRQDMQDRLLTRLGTEMLTIQEQARMKQLELEGGRPATPFLEYYGDPELSAGLSQYGSSIQPWQPTPIPTFNPDLSGFGMMMAAAINKWPSGDTGDGGTTVNVSSTPNEYTGSFGGWENAAQATPVMNYLTPRAGVLGVGGR